MYNTLQGNLRPIKDKVIVSDMYFGEQVTEAGIIIKDDVYDLRATISAHIADPKVNAILTTGGTGFTARDNTQKALQLLFDLHIDGFGELFRQLSYEEIGNSTVQSRVFAGLANGTIIFCLPGSPGACRTGWEKIIADQLDSSHKPCNFVDKLRFS